MSSEKEQKNHSTVEEKDKKEKKSKKEKKEKKEKKDKTKDKTKHHKDDAMAAEPTSPVKQIADPNTKNEKRKRDEPDSTTTSIVVDKKPKAELSKPSFSNDWKPHPNAVNRNAEEVAKYREDNTIAVSETDPEFNPTLSFEETNIPPELRAVTKDFAKPTSIQAQCWPIMLAGRDVIGIAETGSGKTLAFLLPGLMHIKKKNLLRKAGPIMLVLAPTRELAMQTAEVATAAGTPNAIYSTCIYGGVDKGPQKRALHDGVQIVVATPGRLKDLIEEGVCSLANLTYLVLDEADRMLDLGFEPDIRFIIGKIPKDRQTLMFSATWPQAIQALGNEFLRSPVRVTIGHRELAACASVTQIVEVIDPFKRMDRLEALLRDYHKSRKNKIIIFVLYKKEAARMETDLQRRNWKAVAIHGDMSQEGRNRAFKQFKDGGVPLLIATDVAARGLDIPDVEYVINYSFPLTIEDYVHRIGRTGRGGKKGIAHTFFTVNDKLRAGELLGLLTKNNQKVPEELTNKFDCSVKRKEHKLYGSHYREDEGKPMPAKSHIKFD